jgi:hypothetical protein
MVSDRYDATRRREDAQSQNGQKKVFWRAQMSDWS